MHKYTTVNQHTNNDCTRIYLFKIGFLHFVQSFRMRSYSLGYSSAGHYLTKMCFVVCPFLPPKTCTYANGLAHHRFKSQINQKKKNKQSQTSKQYEKNAPAVFGFFFSLSILWVTRNSPETDIYNKIHATYQI